MAQKIETDALTATNTTVVVGNTSTAILAANDNRRFAIITNVSDEVIALGFGAAAVASTGVSLGPATAGGPYDRIEVGSDRLVYKGAINGISASGTKSVAVVEFV